MYIFPTECKDGYYNSACSGTRGHCLNGTVCIKDTGHCPTGCIDHFKYPLCQGKYSCKPS